VKTQFISLAKECPADKPYTKNR